MEYSEERIKEIRQAVIEGDTELLLQAVTGALEAGFDPQLVLDQGLTQGSEIVGRMFEEGNAFLPELMQTGIALKAAMQVLIPHLKLAGNTRQKGTIVMATIKSDVHDIGKNLVSSLLTASGYEVHDLGVDVPISRIIDTACQVGAQLIGCSALLTTSIPYLRELVTTLEARKLRSRFKLMLGGASMTPTLAAEIGADGTAPNAASAVSLAGKLINQSMGS